MVTNLVYKPLLMCTVLTNTKLFEFAVWNTVEILPDFDRSARVAGNNECNEEGAG